jgi:DNA invertase Pin-like site-specific DNA recombinase
MGRPPKLTYQQRHEVLARREAGEPLAEIARTYNVNRMTIRRLKP